MTVLFVEDVFLRIILAPEDVFEDDVQDFMFDQTHAQFFIGELCLPENRIDMQFHVVPRWADGHGLNAHVYLFQYPDEKMPIKRLLQDQIARGARYIIKDGVGIPFHRLQEIFQKYLPQFGVLPERFEALIALAHEVLPDHETHVVGEKIKQQKADDIFLCAAFQLYILRDQIIE